MARQRSNINYVWTEEKRIMLMKCIRFYGKKWALL